MTVIHFGFDVTINDKAVIAKESSALAASSKNNAAKWQIVRNDRRPLSVGGRTGIAPTLRCVKGGQIRDRVHLVSE